MFQVKICGITTLEDARLAVEAGADAIGLNFHAPSPRSVTSNQAAEVCQALQGDVCLVGVFVNWPVDEIRQLANQLGLDAVQLHGDEPAEMIGQLDPLPVIRAVRCREEGLEEVSDVLREANALGRMPTAVLVDAHVDGQFGGTGKQLDWSAMHVRDGKVAGCPLVLAGGLNAENVDKAITQLAPAAVDTASGVERTVGRKDPLLMARFVQAARKAFARLEASSGS